MVKILYIILGSYLQKIYEKYKVENTVYCTSKMGDSISNPWNISVELNKKLSKEQLDDINDMINKIIERHEEITKEIINDKIKLNSY